MKQRWKRRAALLLAAVKLFIPVYAEDTAAEPAPEIIGSVETVTEEATPVPEEPEALDSGEEQAEVLPAPEATVEVAEETTPEPTATAEATFTPEPTATADVETTPEPTATADVETTPEPTASADVETTPEPSATAEVEMTPEPSATAEAAVTPEPTATPEPVETPEATVLPENTETPSVTEQPPSELIYGDFEFVINDDDTLTLTAWSGEDLLAELPAEVENRKVVRIAASAFAEKNAIERMVVPEGVIVIEEGAFEGCVQLREIDVPASLEQAANIFEGCDSLETVRLNISGEIIMADAQCFVRELVEIVDEQEVLHRIEVNFDHAITDICVLDGGRLQVEGAMLVEEGHSFAVSAEGALVVTETGSITVMGSLINAGSVECAGRIVACAGFVDGVESVVREHSWMDGECVVCGELQTFMLDVEAKRELFEKTYDGTSDMDISVQDFALSGVMAEDDVYIAAVNSDFSEKDAGSYKTNLSFVLSGDDADRYAVKQSEIAVSILPKPVTVTPNSKQSKVYGQKDPTLRAGYKGTVEGEVLFGSLSREKGESAGKYRILSGTLDSMNPNYAIEIAEAYFEIREKDISDSSITVKKISNQRYSGEEIKPSAEIYDGSSKLKSGRDFKLTYSDNVSVGTATIHIAGRGNYSGSRDVTFRIIKVNSGTIDSDLSELNDFGSAGTLIDENTPIVTDTLTVDGNDLGSLVFGEDEMPLSFIQTRRMLEDDENLYSILTVTVQEVLDDFYIPVEGEYGLPRMRLSMDALRAMQNAGYTHLEMIVGEAEARIPLDGLYAEFISMNGTLSVDHYEVQLWPVKDEQLTQVQKNVLNGRSLAAQPVHFMMLAVPTVDGLNAEPVDALEYAEGVQILFAPEIAPDYANKVYEVVHILEENDQTENSDAVFVLDGEKVKSVLLPATGGMYALAEK